VQNIVVVSRYDQLLNRQSHLLGQVAGKDIAEVTGRH